MDLSLYVGWQRWDKIFLKSFLSTTKQGDKRIGSVCLFIRLWALSSLGHGMTRITSQRTVCLWAYKNYIAVAVGWLLILFIELHTSGQFFRDAPWQGGEGMAEQTFFYKLWIHIDT